MENHSNLFCKPRYRLSKYGLHNPFLKLFFLHCIHNSPTIHPVFQNNSSCHIVAHEDHQVCNYQFDAI